MTIEKFMPVHRHPNGGGWVADSATVHESVRIEKGAVICEKVEIGEYTWIEEKAWIEKGAKIGKGVIAKKGSMIMKGAVVGDGAFICEGCAVYKNEVIDKRSLRGGSYYADDTTISVKGKVIATFNFSDGDGPIPAHQHPNGGGWVADSATVHETAFVHRDANVNEYAWIEEDVTIGSGARIEYGVFIGKDSVVNPNVCIGYNALICRGLEIERGSLIRAGAIIKKDMDIKKFCVRDFDTWDRGGRMFFISSNIIEGFKDDCHHNFKRDIETGDNIITTQRMSSFRNIVQKPTYFRQMPKYEFERLGMGRAVNSAEVKGEKK